MADWRTVSGSDGSMSVINQDSLLNSNPITVNPKTLPASNFNYENWNGDLSGYLQYMANHGSDSDYDRFMDFLLNNYQIDKANEWTAKREDTQYQRLVADLRAAGINPYALLQGASPVSSASASASYSGAYKTNESIKKEQNDTKWVGLFTTLLSSLIMAVAVAI